MGLIYKVKNKINKKHYIGQTNQEWPKRKYGHIRRPGQNSAIDSAILKYGQENFEWKIIDEANDQDVLNMLERLHISRYEASVEEWGYNIREGGSNGALSEKTKQKISKANKGKKVALGRKHSQKTKRKMSESKRGNLNPMYGKDLTRQHRQRISQSLKGRSCELETRKKISIKHQKKKWPGASFYKGRNPEKKCWRSSIFFKGKQKYLGTFIDPVSASIIRNFVWNQIYTP